MREGTARDMSRGAIEGAKDSIGESIEHGKEKVKSVFQRDQEERQQAEEEPEEEPEEAPTPEPVEPRPELPPSNIDLDQLEAVRAAVDASLRQADLEHVATYRYEERGLVVSIAADDILFDTGSTRISRLGRSIVAAVAEPLSSFPNDVLVEGHTDDVPLDRDGYTNWNLSTDRAVAVLSLLATEHRIEQTRLGAVGYGEFRPVVPNDSPANRSMNRRVDILVVGQGV
jgi:chemotaxis protein MotB